MNFLLSRIICLVCLVVFLSASLFAQDRIFLKAKADGNRGYVIELSGNHVIIRFSIEEIEKIERGPDSATSVESAGDAKSPPAAGLQGSIQPAAAAAVRPVPAKTGPDRLLRGFAPG